MKIGFDGKIYETTQNENTPEPKNEILKAFEDEWMDLEIFPVFVEDSLKNLEYDKNKILNSSEPVGHLIEYFAFAKEHFEKAQSAYQESFLNLKDEAAEKVMKEHWGNILLYIARAEELIKFLRSSIIGN